MNTDELANRLHDLVDGEHSTPPTELLLSRGRSARRRRRGIAGGAITALVVAGAITLSGHQDTPAVQLAAAVAASDDISYRVTVTSANRESVQTTEGAFDPTTHTGYLSSSVNGVVYYERLVDGIRYVSSSGSKDVWKQYPGTRDRLTYDMALDSTASVDPQVLFDTLTQAGARITGLHFEIDGLVGDVTVNADNRIASVSYREDGTQVTVTLSDYGTPVTVDPPANVVVVK